jgi:ribosomal protein L37AE/L43A
MRLLCPRCRKVQNMKEHDLGQHKCAVCGKIVSGRARQIEDLATGTFGHARGA